MNTYKNDSLADALVLYEHANVYLDEKNEYKFRTDYYFKIKLFNKNAFHLANIEIPLYKDEYVKEINAIAYNLKGENISKTFLNEKNIYKTQENEYWNKTSFAIPNIKEGTIIEYTYSVISPYSRLDDWYFQSEIPKLESKYDATLLVNYKYNLRLFGVQQLDKKDITFKKNCITITGLGSGGCKEYSFGMKNIPAFEEEDYMLSKKNYLSRLVLDLISYTNTEGVIKNYTKTWKDTDKTLKKNFFDNQTTKTSFFKKNIPQEILNTENELDKAKQIYQFIQNKLFWNKKYWTQGNLKIKKAFEEGSGSVDAINLILYNSLRAANIESYIVVSSTRNNGLPTKVYPLTKDFNYILVKAVIGNETFFLDATNKKTAFGQIPFKCINGDGRVLDFKKGSYWEQINTNTLSIISSYTELSFNEESELQGKLQVTKTGYNAVSERNFISNKSTDEYLDYFESKHPNILVDDYTIKNEHNLDKHLIQRYDITKELYTDNNFIRINPHIYGRISINPFKLDRRIYDIDYGYPRTFLNSIKLNIPLDKYEIISLPENKAFALPNNGGDFMLNVSQNGNSINISTKLYIMKKTFSPNEYKALKEFYNQIIKAEEASIKLKKLN
ncbi:hypothetical protein [Psychroserpens sp. S379A]|uniref:hypothetical protein n=1 Tax=Psychroserpens sp. S379A TaxID=3415137 RepID=UPI003C7C0A33